MKTRWKVLIAAALVFTAASALAFGYLRSRSFQAFARARFQSALEKATGLECRIAKADIDVFGGSIEAAGLELYPRTETAGPVRLQVGGIKARMSLSSLWRFRVRLAELNIVHPRIEVIAADSGQSESPWDPGPFLKNLKLSLRLEASKATVRNGWLKVNERGAPFNLAFNDLDCEVRYSKELPSYKIRLKYSNSRIFWERRNMEHDLEATADLSLQGVAIDSFRFRKGGTFFTGAGAMTDWGSPTFAIHATGVLDGRDLILTTPSLNEGRGEIRVSADVRYDRDGVYSLGKFSAESGGYRKMAFSNLQGGFRIERDVLYLRDVSGDIGRGNFQLTGDLQLTKANRELNQLKILTKNVSLINVGRLLDLPLIDFENAADATSVLTWFSGRELKVDCDGWLHGLQPEDSKSGKSTLLEGPLHFTYYESGTVQIYSANLKSPDTTIVASGGRDSLFKVQLSTSRLSEPLSLLAGFSPPIAGLIRKNADMLQMEGGYSLQGSVRVKSSADIAFDGSVEIKNGRWRSFRAERLSAQASFSSPRLKLQSLEVRESGQTLEGQVDLDFPGGEEVSNFKFQGSARNVSLAFLKEFGVRRQVSGSLSGSGMIYFNQGVWGGDGQILVEKGNFEGEAFDRLRIRAQLENRLLRLFRAEAFRGAANLSAEGRVDLETRALDIAARLEGLSLQAIPTIQEKNLPVQGSVGISGAIDGTLDAPLFQGSFRLEGFRYGAWSFKPGKGNLNFKNDRLQVDADMQSDFGVFSVQAELSTEAGLPGKAKVDFENLDIQKIIPGKVPTYLQDVSTALKGKVDVEGPFENTAALKIRGELDGAHFKIQDYEVHNSGRIHFTASEENVLLENVKIEGEGTSLVLNGAIPLDDSRNLEMDLKGSLNLESLKGIDKKLAASGEAALDIRASGARRNPQIIGRVTIQNAKLDYPGLPFHFSSIQGDVVFSRNLVRFENVHGTASSGTIRASGIVEHQNAALRSISMGIAIRNARLPYPKDFRSVINSDLVLNGTKDVKILAGDIDVIRAEYTRSFNLLEQLTSRSSTQSGPLTTFPFLLGMRLNVDIHSDGGLLIDNELTRLRGSMRLTLRGTPAYPSLTGRVESSEGAIFFRGSRFDISRASADFIDRNRINPVLEIRAEANVKTYRLILDAVGDLDHLTLNITSDPAMSTVDILSLLTTGKADPVAGTVAETAAERTRRQSQMAGISAASVLSENLTGVIGKRVQRIFGLESFRVDPFLAGAENDPTARITLSERLAKDLVVTFSRNLTTNQEQIVIIEYDVGADLSVVATRDEDGKFGLDFRFRKRLR